MIKKGLNLNMIDNDIIRKCKDTIEEKLNKIIQVYDFKKEGYGNRTYVKTMDDYGECDSITIIFNDSCAYIIFYREDPTHPLDRYDFYRKEINYCNPNELLKIDTNLKYIIDNYKNDFFDILINFLRLFDETDRQHIYYATEIKELNDTIDDLNKQVKFLTDRLNDK